MATLAGRAQAAPLRAHLRWERPAGTTCIGQQALEWQVEALLGRDVFVAGPDADVLLQGQIQARGNAWLATLSVIGDSGQARAVRELRSEQADCSALNTALVVVLSTLFEAPSSEAFGGSANHDLGAGSDRDSSLAFGVGGCAAVGALPGLYGGGSLLLHVHARARAFAPIWLEASLFPPVERLDASSHGAGFEAALLGLAICPELSAGRWTGALCAGVRGGVMRAQGEQLAVARDPVRGLLQLTPEVALLFMTAVPVGVRLSLGGSLNLIRPHSYYEQPDGSRRELHRPDLFGASMGLALIIGTR